MLLAKGLERHLESEIPLHKAYHNQAVHYLSGMFITDFTVEVQLEVVSFLIVQVNTDWDAFSLTHKAGEKNNHDI
jgi:hypothetical protein